AGAWLAALAAEMSEVGLVVLDAADRERQIGAQPTVFGVDLVRRRAIRGVQLLLDLVHLVDVALVQLVMLFHRSSRNAIQLANRRERPRRQILPRHDEPPAKNDDRGESGACSRREPWERSRPPAPRPRGRG